MKYTENDSEAHFTQLKRQHKLSRENGIDATLSKHGLNVLIVPSETKNATKPSAMAGKTLSSLHNSLR